MSGGEAELAMPLGDYDATHATKVSIAAKISMLEKQIADIDNQLMSLYARLSELI